MFIGSDNQFRNLYVMKAYKDSESTLAAVGDLTLKVDTAKSNVYLVYKDTEDTITSDLISIKNLLYAKSTKAADMARTLNSQSVTINENPVSGQDYVLNVEVRNFVALGDDSTHIKFGAVHAVKGMTKSDFYKAMAVNLAKNLSREPSPILNVLLTKNDSAASGKKDSEVAVLLNGKMQNLANLTATETYTNIIIDEVEQPWRRGVAQVEPVNFNTTCGTVLVDGDDVIWGTVEKEKGDPVNNGKQIADMEWFYHGTRGDIYREATYPDNFDFKPLVDETKAYSTLDIHFAYVGPGVEVAKSERTITVVCADAAELNKLITAIKTATGVDAGAVS
jgi:small nuclear ribonucleoprotein (snRNP)-like protein